MIEHCKDESNAGHKPVGNGSPSHIIRVEFRKDAEAEPVSLFVTVSEVDGSPTVTLMQDYPDFKPEVGWLVKGRNLALVVNSVDGRVLTCRTAETDPTDILRKARESAFELGSSESK